MCQTTSKVLTLLAVATSDPSVGVRAGTGVPCGGGWTKTGLARRELSGGGSDMCLRGKCCCVGCGVIEERMRKEGRGERRPGEGGIETSPKLSIAIMSTSALPKLKELLEWISRRGPNWGGSIDMVR